MSSISLVDRAPPGPTTTRRLLVSWQDPDSRSITPVGVLTQGTPDGSDDYQFGYLRRAETIPGFRPFVGFPELNTMYRSPRLFPFFENRVMSSARADFGSYVESLGLTEAATPFEILAHSEGRRATDTVEVFPEPVVDAQGRVTCCFNVRGVRSVDDAHDVIDGLSVGDQLSVAPEPENPIDPDAVIVSEDGRQLGWVPAFLTPLIHEPLNAFGEEGIRLTVERIGGRNGPVHQRLLCRLTVRWPMVAPPFSGPEFELAARTD